MKKLIALWGASRTGKTATLKQVHKLLEEKSTNYSTEVRRHGDDLRDIFTINRLKVGIETAGDPGSQLKQSLRLFEQNDCDLIICATRTRGKTTDWINSLEPTYTISRRGQSALTLTDQRDQSNNVIAKLIFNEAMSALDTDNGE